MSQDNDYAGFMEWVAFNGPEDHEANREDDRFDVWEGDDDWAEFAEWCDSMEQSIRDDLDTCNE